MIFIVLKVIASSCDRYLKVMTEVSVLILDRCQTALRLNTIDSLSELMNDVKGRSGIVEILSVLDIQFSRSSAFHDLLRQLSSDCDDDERRLLLDQLQLDTITACGLVPGCCRSLNQKMIKVKTRSFYKQQKYNLFREESEGFARLIVLLFSGQCDTDTALSIIGLYNIDPNRVVDLILESIERCPSKITVYVDILRNLENADHALITKLLGFKFKFLMKQVDPDVGLYALAARCVLHKLVQSSDDLCTLLKSIDLANDSNLLLFVEQLIIAQIDEKNDNLDVVEQILDSIAGEDKLEFTYAMDALCSFFERRFIDNLYNASWNRSAKQQHEASKSFEQYLEDLNAQRILQAARMLMSHASRSPRLLTKIVRIAELESATIVDKLKYADIFEQLLILIVLPSVAMLDGNEPLVLELWFWIGAYGYKQRFRLYGYWESHVYENSGEMVRARRQQVLQKARYITKRITKDNVKGFSRLLAKSSHCNPLICLDYILQSIQRYDNFIIPVVDSLKYLSHLSFDVILFLVIKALADGNRQQKKCAGTAFSPWLKSLCLFASCLCRKYSVDLSPPVDYVINQLKKRKCLDLLLLQELLEKMCGTEVFSGVTEHQLECQAGGEILRAEGGCFLATSAPNTGLQRNSRKSMQRLREVLMSDGRALDLCVLIAQMRDWVVFGNDPGIHPYPKFIGFLYDQCQNTLCQLLEFVGIPSADQLVGLPADIGVLVNKYRVAVDASFMIARPAYNCFTESKFEELVNTAACADEEYEEDELTVKRECYFKASEAVMAPLVDLVRTLQVGRLAGANIVTKGGLKRDHEFWECSCSFALFYATFWTSRVYDIECPSRAYERQIEHTSQTLASTPDSTHKLRRERERLKTIIQRLDDEHANHVTHVELFKWRMRQEMDSWFVKKSQTKTEIITEFLQLCVFPRCILSEIDAVYCSKFINELHRLKLQNFSTIICFDRTFTETMVLVASCTECEAERFGRFLACMLETVKQGTSMDKGYGLKIHFYYYSNSREESSVPRDRFQIQKGPLFMVLAALSRSYAIMRWHRDKEIYDKECLHYPGFLTMFRHASTPSSNANQQQPSTEKSPEEQLDYENFRHVCFKWHYTLTRSIVSCLESGDYPQIRNALKILTKLLVADYPKVVRLYENIEKKVEAICSAQKDKRDDVATLAVAYLGQLRAIRGNVVPEEQFHFKPQPPPSASAPIQNSKTSPPQITNENADHDGKGDKKPAQTMVVISARKRVPPLPADKPFFEAKRPNRVSEAKR
ncbi:hypothetical protein ACOME3_002739 [Neoechinorhynchus agilis]